MLGLKTSVDGREGITSRKIEDSVTYKIGLVKEKKDREF